VSWVDEQENELESSELYRDFESPGQLLFLRDYL
jgi:hypothetical protein